IEYLTLDHTMENIDAELGRDLGMDSPTIHPRFMYFVGEPVLSRRMTRVYFLNQLTFCDLPFYKRPGTVGTLEMFDDPKGFDLGNGDTWNATSFDAAFKRAILANLLLPATLQVHRALDREKSRYRTLLVTLAGQSFRRDHGHFPHTLSDLVPEYLDLIPIDNYDGKPLKYRFDPEGSVVYSVHENLSDDGGHEWNQENLPFGKNYPDDFGSQMRLPARKPLAAPKPVNP
ncbi:MAG: hypothetical protein JJ992_02975, partial [Planctomycetes bacterium]|nr:hypothetical protein [Planctomycetota bacterium]